MGDNDMSANYVVRHLAETPVTHCPCGDAFRIITPDDGAPASLHRVEIRGDARKHYHRRHTEMYYCLEGEGELELGEERIAFTPGTAVVIPPGTPHAARGKFKIINIVIPPFDPADEIVVEP